MIIREKKNPAIATKTAVAIESGARTMESAASVATMVPMLPIKRQMLFLHKHLVSKWFGCAAARNRAETRMIKPSTPRPKAIQIPVVIAGRRLK